jgi:capsular polysaccharide biosynthesis protein
LVSELSLRELEVIDVSKICRILYLNKKIILFFLICSLLISFFLCVFIPKKYSTETTFFIPAGVSDTGSPGLLGYAKLLGGNGTSTNDSYIMALLSSRRIKYEIAGTYMGEFEADIKAQVFEDRIENTMQSKLDYIVMCLKLEKDVRISIDENQIYKIKYLNKDPNVSFDIVNLYLQNLHELNKELDLFGSKEIVKILDASQFPSLKNPDYPNTSLLICSLLFISLIGSIMYICFVNRREILAPEAK